MPEAIYQFDFSEDTIKKTNRTMLLFLPVLYVCFVGFTLVISGFKIKESLLISGHVTLIMLVIWGIEIPLLNWRARKIKVFIHNDKIIKQCGRHETGISWENIARLKIKEDNKGKIIHIQIKGKDKSVLWLGGLNEMGKLAGLIKERISGDVLVNIKRNRLDIRVIGIISAVIAVIIMTIIGLTGNKAMDIFALFIAFGTSGFLLLYRPLSKMDASLKWIEIVCSLLLGLLGVIGFITFLNTGQLP